MMKRAMEQAVSLDPYVSRNSCRDIHRLRFRSSFSCIQGNKVFTVSFTQWESPALSLSIRTMPVLSNGRSWEPHWEIYCSCLRSAPTYTRKSSGSYETCRVIEMSIGLCRYPQKRQTYEFCDHVGPCSTDSICRYVEMSTTCERDCGCPQSCRRRFPPCQCIDGCGTKCLCQENAHECVYCGCGKMCSTQEIRNWRSQLTIIRQSQVHGQGLDRPESDRFLFKEAR